MVEENFIEDKLAKDSFLESVLLELKVKVVNPRMIRLLMGLVKLFEVGMSKRLRSCQPLSRVVAQQPS